MILSICGGKTKNSRPQKRDGSINFRGTTRFLWEHPITLLTPVTGHCRIQLLNLHCIRSKVKGDIRACGLLPANGRPLCGKRNRIKPLFHSVSFVFTIIE
jgi:hypothetical protein